MVGPVPAVFLEERYRVAQIRFGIRRPGDGGELADKNPGTVTTLEIKDGHKRLAEESRVPSLRGIWPVFHSVEGREDALVCVVVGIIDVDFVDDVVDVQRLQFAEPAWVVVHGAGDDWRVGIDLAYGAGGAHLNRMEVETFWSRLFLSWLVYEVVAVDDIAIGQDAPDDVRPALDEEVGVELVVEHPRVVSQLLWIAIVFAAAPARPRMHVDADLDAAPSRLNENGFKGIKRLCEVRAPCGSVGRAVRGRTFAAQHDLVAHKRHAPVPQRLPRRVLVHAATQHDAAISHRL